MSPTTAHPAFPLLWLPGSSDARKLRNLIPRIPLGACAPGLPTKGDLPSTTEDLRAAQTALSLAIRRGTQAHTPSGSPKSPNKGSAPEPSRELQAFNQPSSSCCCTSCCYSPAPPRALPPGKPSPRRTGLAGAPASFARRTYLPSLRFLL